MKDRNRKIETVARKLLKVCEDNDLTIEETLEMPTVFRQIVSREIIKLQNSTTFKLLEDSNSDSQE